MRKGCKHLRIASVLVIALGVISIIGIRMILGSDVAAGELTGTQLEGALGGLVGLYAFYGFKILAGLIGLALSNKKSILTVILGIILFLCQLVPFLQSGNGTATIIVNIVLLVIPYYYLHNAYRNYKE